MENENRKLRVALLYWKMIPSVRLCGHCQLEELARRGVIEYRTLRTARVKSADLNWADVVVLGRLDSWEEVKLAKALSRSGRYLLYILDDDLLNVPESLPSGKYFGLKAVKNQIRQMLALSDGILSPSPLLLEKYAAGKGIRLMEPAIAPAAFRPHDTKGPVKIGFAGSLDRAGDIEQILGEALLRLHRDFGQQVEFAFYGPMPGFAQALGARHIPYSDSYDEYRATINALDWDIGLAPMPDTPFHACKHYNKFVEYAAAGVAGVYSDVQPYSRLKEEIGVGVFCENTPDSWYEALSRLTEDGAMREKLRQKAAKCAEEMSVAAAAAPLEQALNALKPREKKTIRTAALWGKLCYAVRTVNFIYRNGTHAPAIAVKKLRAALRK